MLKKVALAVAAALAAQAASAGAIDFHGYMRSSAGSTSEGGECAKFTIAGGGFPYAFRLGNECRDNYTELAFSTNVAKTPGGAKFAYHTRFAFGVPNRDSYERLTGDNTLANRENFVTAEGVLPWEGSRLWMGKRFYRETDLHIRDYYYWDASGTGAGVEGIPIGVGKFDVAWIKNQRDGNADQSAHLFDLNWSGIPVWQGAQLQVRGGVAFDNVNDNEVAHGPGDTDYGPGAGIMVTLNQNLMNGFNKAILQYFAGSMSTPNAAWYANGSGRPDNRASWGANTIRFLDYIAVEPTQDFAIHGMLAAERAEGETESNNGTAGADNGKTSNWYAIGVRPIYSLSETFALQGEVSYEQTKLVNGDKPKLAKVTFAPTFRAGKGAWARPELRFFATYAKWNDANGRAGTNRTFVDDKDGFTYGVQLESWW